MFRLSQRGNPVTLPLQTIVFAKPGLGAEGKNVHYVHSFFSECTF